MSEDTSIDLRAVVAEIYDDVARRRRIGEFPPGLERELDAVFARYSPPAALGDDLDALLDRAERAAFIDVDVPTDSARPGVGVVKKTLRKTMAWYLRYVAQQASAMGGALVRAERVLARKVASLEDAVGAVNPMVRDEFDALAPVTLPGDVVDAVVSSVLDSLSAVTEGSVGAGNLGHGRVLVTASADGIILSRLVAAGVDAYGVDARRDLHGSSWRAGLEVRDDDPLDHLRRLDDASLDVVVLVEVIDSVALGSQLALIDRAARVARRDVILVSHHAGTDPVRADLAPGRPLHPSTLAHVLAVRGRTTTTNHLDSFTVVRGAPH